MTDTPATPPAPAAPIAPVVVSAPAKDQPTAWHWTIWMTIVLPFVSIGLFIWVFSQVQPAKWCGVATGAAKLTDTNAIQAVQACFGLMGTQLEIYRIAVLGLLVLIGVGNLGIIYTTLKARVNVEAWGFRGGIGGDDEGNR